MIQLCGKAIVEPLRHLFLLFLEEGVYPDDWKKRNVVPVHKKESKSLIKKYKLTSFLPVFSKVYQRIIFNSLFNYFLENKLFTELQSGFYQVILAPHNSFPLHTRYINILIVTLHSM